MKTIKVKLNANLITVYYRDLFFKNTIYFIGLVLIIAIPSSIYVLVKYKNTALGLMGIIGSLLISLALILIKRSERNIAIKELSKSYNEYIISFNNGEMVVSINKVDYKYPIKHIKFSTLKHFYRIRCSKTHENYIIPKDKISKEELVKLTKSEV